MAKKALAGAMLLASFVLTFAISPAMAQTYPPNPAHESTASGSGAAKVPVIVRGGDLPAPETGALSRTGTSSTVSLVIVGAGLAIVGLALVGVTQKGRHRRTRASSSG
jgi:hypothetical protein